MANKWEDAMRLISGWAAAAAVVCIAATSHAEETLSAATADVGSAPHFVMTSIAGAADRAGLANVQVQEGQALTRVQLAVSRGELDIGTIPIVTTFLMRNGLAMFSELGAAEGAALSENLTAITGFSAGVYHAMTFADSGIEDWDDIKGRRVFIGAPTGGAAVQVQQMIRLITGYEPGTDYEPVQLDWGAGVQGMLDGTIDVVIRPGTLPAGYIDRLTSAGPIRLLGVPEDVAGTETFTRFSNAPGTLPAVISGDIYDADLVDVTNGGATMAIALAVVANAELDDDLIYGITSAYIDGLEGAMATNPWAANLGLQGGVYGLTPVANLRLHPGALRAWEDAGITVPDHLR